MEVDEPAPLATETKRSKGKAPERVGRVLDEHLPWVEKYRPSTLEDLISQGDIIQTIKNFIAENRLPHLLFYGPPGTGKTSTILACARQMYGEKYRSMILELNASDDRGIDVVRDQIKTFASTRRMFDTGVKLVILDEADAMTSAAQAALRRVMEKYTNNVRFCLICNYSSKIIPALQSRCTRFRFSPLKPEQIRNRLDYILGLEQVHISSQGKDALMRLSKGDMRRVLNILQACHAAATTSGAEKINEEDVYHCTGQPDPNDVQRIVTTLMNDSFASAHSVLQQLRVVKGLALLDILGEVGEYLDSIEIPQPMRIYLLEKLADLEYRLTSGATEHLQVTALVGIFKMAVNIAATSS
ncbi:DNA replication factor [Piptocephalis cylindrospora]|uniref:Replication factor C subunit 3 n=1 Tax=Piptocephalis cylindrospora TaxID=1907219 RepID=A0A4P9Y618_9FUNG|nr:DNA replication factor [Piptocephalis cylindrospora]|eukprot:RKP14498.1 DNA replication factor [Piptocephalis cylindrospora]